jgi:hypothetical protein
VVGVVLDGGVVGVVGVVVDVVDVVGVVVDVVDVVVGQGVVEVVLDDEVDADDVPVGEHGSVVGVVLDVVLVDELVLLGPVRNTAGCASLPSSLLPPSPPLPPSDERAAA